MIAYLCCVVRAEARHTVQFASEARNSGFPRVYYIYIYSRRHSDKLWGVLPRKHTNLLWTNINIVTQEIAINYGKIIWHSWTSFPNTPQEPERWAFKLSEPETIWNNCPKKLTPNTHVTVEVDYTRSSLTQRRAPYPWTEYFFFRSEIHDLTISKTFSIWEDAHAV